MSKVSSKAQKDLAMFLAEYIMSVGDDLGKKATRIQFRLGRYPNEVAGGGLISSSLAHVIDEGLSEAKRRLTSLVPSEDIPATQSLGSTSDARQSLYDGDPDCNHVLTVPDPLPTTRQLVNEIYSMDTQFGFCGHDIDEGAMATIIDFVKWRLRVSTSPMPSGCAPAPSEPPSADQP